MAKTKKSQKTLPDSKKKAPKTIKKRALKPIKKRAPKPTKKKAPKPKSLKPVKTKVPEAEKKTHVKCNCRMTEGTPVCPICCEHLGKEPQLMYVATIVPNEAGPSTGRSNLGGVVALRCGHVLHRVCVEGWITENRARNKRLPVPCPCCRKEIKGPGDLTTPFHNFDEKNNNDISNLEEDSANKCRRRNCLRARKEAEETIEALAQANRFQSSQVKCALDGKQRLQREKSRIELENERLQREKSRFELENERLQMEQSLIKLENERLQMETSQMEFENGRLREEIRSSSQKFENDKRSWKRLEEKYNNNNYYNYYMKRNHEDHVNKLRETIAKQMNAIYKLTYKKLK